MSAEGDALLRDIGHMVRGTVPVQWEDQVIELTARSVIHVLSTPAFVNNLLVVQQLQRENWELRSALLSFQKAAQVRQARSAARKAKGPVKKAPKRPAAPKKATAKKAPTSNVRAFKRGAAGR